MRPGATLKIEMAGLPQEDAAKMFSINKEPCYLRLSGSHSKRSFTGKRILKCPCLKGGFRKILSELSKSPLPPFLQRGEFGGVSG
jgi:hypothetical protein